MSADQSSPHGREPDSNDNMADHAPEHQEPLAESATQKRKASSSSPPPRDASAKSPKRTKLHDQGSEEGTASSTPADAGPAATAAVTAAAPSPAPSTARRESASQEERKRGKRLFGGLLNLSQGAAGSRQKRRQDIERRQQEKAQQNRAESNRHREEKLTKLTALRKVEQLKFDEQVMKTKHANMLDMAHHLKTKSRPEIYYLPWDITQEQEDTIRDQVRNVQSIIDREVSEFERRKEQRMKALGIPAPKPPSPEPPEAREPVGKSDHEPPADSPLLDSTNKPAPPHASKPGGGGGQEKEPDRADDVMIEEDEDTVIY
ncbi:pinin/SDK/memA/ protein conserved region-domain-containing protein [Xylariaceae sp. FL0804]|nr:pinin/SDK/memA/ protein conserved region-domain-containing protein [Xylariaceae sp. FL0804]